MTRDVDRPRDDAEWNYSARRETPTARLDRNWDDLLQELRVARTGEQVLISPVVLHRVLCRQHARRTLVAARATFALAGFTTLGLAVVGVCRLIFDVVLGLAAGVTAEVVAFWCSPFCGVCGRWCCARGERRSATADVNATDGYGRQPTGSPHVPCADRPSPHWVIPRRSDAQ